MFSHLTQTKIFKIARRRVTFENGPLELFDFVDALSSRPTLVFAALYQAAEASARMHDEHCFAYHSACLRPLSCKHHQSPFAAPAAAPAAAAAVSVASAQPRPPQHDTEIDRIMAKIEQDNRILAELDKSRSTVHQQQQQQQQQQQHHQQQQTSAGKQAPSVLGFCHGLQQTQCRGSATFLVFSRKPMRRRLFRCARHTKKLHSLET